MVDLRTIAEASELLAQRWRDDGLLQAVLFPHQARFCASEKSEAWLFGANRSGKTEAAALASASFLRFGILDPRQVQKLLKLGVKFDHNPVRVWMISLTNELSRNIFQAKLFDNGARIDPRPPLIPTHEIESWNISTQTLKLKNGSIGIFKSGEGGRDVFQAQDVDLATFDEVPPKDVYNEVSFRIGGGRKLLIRGAATILPPAGQHGGISWMFSDRVTPWQQKGKTPADCNAASPTMDIFTAGMRDNPTILPEEIARLASIMPTDSPEYLIRVEGLLLPSVGGTLCYPKFSRAYHVIRDSKLIPHLPLCLGVDFNPENGVWTIGQRVGNTFRVVDEICLEKSHVLAMCSAFRERVPTHGAELWIYGDATGRRLETQTGLSTYHLIAQYLVGYPVPITHKIPDSNPGERDRIDAVNLRISPPTGERLFEVDERCVETIKDLEGSKYNTKGKIDKRGGRRSDGMDCVGYWITYEAPAHASLVQKRGVRSIGTPSYFNIPGRSSSGLARAVQIGRLSYGK